MTISPGLSTTPGGMLLGLATSMPWLPPTLLVVHLFSAAMVIGSVVAFDLRLLGFWRQIDVRELHRVLIPLALLFVLPAAASGALLFSFHADTLVGDGIFVLKIVALFAAAINAMIFATGPWQSAKNWQPLEAAPSGARLCGLLSILLLACIATLGVLLATRIAAAAA